MRLLGRLRAARWAPARAPVPTPAPVPLQDRARAGGGPRRRPHRTTPPLTAAEVGLTDVSHLLGPDWGGPANF